jgi:hypothetical protein
VLDSNRWIRLLYDELLDWSELHTLDAARASRPLTGLKPLRIDNESSITQVAATSGERLLMRVFPTKSMEDKNRE